MAIDKDAVTVSPREQPPPNNSNDDASYKRDPVSLSGGHSPSTLLRTFLTTTLERIVPLTQAGVDSGAKVFGAAIFDKKQPPAAESGGILREVTVGTNTETASPLLHGEIQTIQQFYGMPKAEGRPDAKDTVFFATHEPCSLCLSGITWGGWDNFFYLFTYEDTRDAFSIPHDIRILEEVFRVPSTCAHETASDLSSRPLYRAHNAFFSSYSCAELLAMIPASDAGRGELVEMWDEVRRVYGTLADGYRESKDRGGADIPLA
ncbi:hypothetical protein C6P46_006752 [Rhodotorula mucilaginosa]|uniref:CMP/dCMP-type deaminase domain-containing protein n=1 Tax=Rhodotorula mucilaginosa TaxID=5537 RepID=A0A9P6VVL4_RHOMI|nr:hypothetical protein C6P46_006752 [Rhodotorula mucilaginosa]